MDMRHFNEAFTDEHGDTVHCERCEYYPATAECDYVTEDGEQACDLICENCAGKLRE